MLFVERNDVEFYIVLSLGDFAYFLLSMFTVILQKLYDGVVDSFCLLLVVFACFTENAGSLYVVWRRIGV